MASYSDRNRSKNSGGQGSQGQRFTMPEIVKAKPIEEDYVQKAEGVMRALLDPGQKSKKVTTTKIRNLFSLVADVCGEEERRAGNTLQDESVAKLKRMYVRAVYEFGRDEATKEFIKKAELLEHLKWIENDQKKLIRFTHYMEALVAFHRYFGGKEA